MIEKYFPVLIEAILAIIIALIVKQFLFSSNDTSLIIVNLSNRFVEIRGSGYESEVGAKVSPMGTTIAENGVRSTGSVGVYDIERGMAFGEMVSMREATVDFYGRRFMVVGANGHFDRDSIYWK